MTSIKSMSKRMKSTIVALTALAVIGGSSMTMAGSKHERFGQGMNLEKMKVVLDLTEEQVDQLQPMFDARKEARKTSRTEHKALMKQLKTVVEKGGSQEDLELLAEQVAVQSKARFLQRAAMLMSVRDVLTEEQRIKAEKLRSMKMRNLGDRKGHGIEHDRQVSAL